MKLRTSELDDIFVGSWEAEERMPLPTNWSAFRARLRVEEQQLRWNIMAREAILPQLVTAKLPYGLARSFVLAPVDLLHLWIANGPSVAREYAVYAGDAMARLVAELRNSARFAPQSWLRALGYRLMAQGLGAPVTRMEGADEIAMLQAAEQGIEDLPRSWRVAGALAAIALGVPEALPRWDGGPPLQPRSEFGELPQRDLMSFARAFGELGGCKETCHSVLGVFLDEIECKTAEWDALWWVGYLWLVQVEGHAPHGLGKPFSRWVGELQ